MKTEEKKYLLIACCFFLGIFLCSSSVFTQDSHHKIKITQYPSSYEAYFNSLQESNEPDTLHEPKPLRIDSFVYQKMNIVANEKNTLIFTGENEKTKIIVTFKDFDTLSHKITENSTIDEKTVYGFDGGLYPGIFYPGKDVPEWKEFKYQYLDKIEFNLDDKIYTDIPSSRAFYFNDPNSIIGISIYKIPKQQLLIIEISSGENAGTYTSYMFFKNGKYVTDYQWEYGFGWYTNTFGKDYFNCKDKKGCIYVFYID